MNTVKTGVPSPVPNHSMASTSQAMGGVPSSTVTQGRAIMAAVIDIPAATPSTLPSTSASDSPAKARRAVTASCGHNASAPWPCISCSSICAVSSGVGSTSGPYQAASASHSAMPSSRLAMAPQPLQR